MESTTLGPTHTTITIPGVASPDTPSIRAIIRGGILAVQPKDRIKARVVEHHPTSAAARKFDKHYAWYRATMKKAGELNEGGEPTAE